jgi:signal transduction histidine kinase
MLLVNVIVVITVVACLNFLVTWFFHTYLYRQNQEILWETAHQVQEVIKYYDSGDNSLPSLSNPLRIIDESANVHVSLLDADNRILLNSFSDFNPYLLQQNAGKIRAGLLKHGYFSTTFKDPNDTELDIMLTACSAGLHNHYLAVAFIPVADVTNWLSEILRLVWWASLLVLLLSIPALYWLSVHITSPLRKMEELARQMTSGDLSCAMEIYQTDEVGRLAQSFNDMAQELSRVEQHRREFLSNVSHELRTPLTSIRGFVQGLLDETIPAEQHEHYLSRIYLETQRLSHIVDDLLDLARLREGRVTLNLELVDLWEICREVAENMEFQAQAKGIELIIQLPEEPAIIHGDRSRLAQILYNLLDNAIKFSRPKGTVSLQGLKHNEWQIKVIDLGPGIEQHELLRLFERFYRVAEQNISGTGLGLAITKLLAEAHKGSITVESTPGRGSTFTLHLPL